jgi:potassium-dependent mechanosensitive channel
MKHGPIFRALASALLLLVQLGFAHAFDDTALLSAEREATGMRSDLERVQSVLDQDGVTDVQLAEQRDVVEQLRLNAVAEAEKMAAPLDDVKQQLNQLGPPPAAGQKETDAIATQRLSLNDAVARFTAAKKQFELIGIEAEQMSGKVSGQQRTQFFQRIFKPDKSILNPQLWRDTVVGAGLLASRLGSLLSTWWHEQVPNVQWGGLAILPAAAAVLWMLFRLLNLNVSGWLPSKSEDTLNFSSLRRLWRVVFGTLCVFAGIAVFDILLIVSTNVASLSTPRFDLLVTAFIGVLTSSIFNSALAYFICSPREPRLRLISVDDRTASSVPLFVFFASLIQSLAAQISVLSDQLLLPVSLVAGQSAIAAAALIALAGLLLLVLRKQSNTTVPSVPEPHYLTWFVSFMPLLWLLLAVAILGLLFGYLALAYFISGKILDTVLVVVWMVLIHHLIDALSDTLQNPASKLGQKLRSLTTMGERGISRFALTLRTLADIMLVVIGIPWLLALWTVTWVDFRSFINNAVVGFRVGNVTVSPFNLISMIGILALGIILTRFITRWLDKRILTQTRLNKGVQDSVRTSANYLGYILAGAFALSATGFDFTSVALVAGALGVGIGFGLQSIVNNFVSGLILLAERPIRVGDWVVINDAEGIVKKINVRATEIETFDNCTIIVPNSNLITGVVRNWTHQDTLGRFLVSVGVAHGSNADDVQKTLTEIVTSHGKVLRYPPPLVQLAKFSSQAMDFEVRGHVADVFEAAQVASDLRFTISKQFREKGVTIPSFPDFGHHK